MMVTISNDIKGFIAVIVLVILYEIVKWGVTGIIKDIRKLQEIRGNS